MAAFSREDQLSFDAVNTVMIIRMRVILAASTLLVIYIDPVEPFRQVSLIYLTLVLFNIYAAVFYLLSRRDKSLVSVRFAHWIDILWCLILIVLSNGISSIFFFLFFFAILSASFRFGFAEGLRVTAASVLLFIGIGYLTAPGDADFELNRFLLKPAYLSIFGYMFSFWGGQELANKRRLALLKDISKLSNPRFGVDQTNGFIHNGFNTPSACCGVVYFDENLRFF